MGLFSKLKNVFTTPTKKLIPNYHELVKDCHVHIHRKLELEKICIVIAQDKNRYQVIQSLVGIPWTLVAALHYREASNNFNTCLHNGELLKNVNLYGTRLVPKGRGKNKNWNWEQAAVDALLLEQSKFPKEWGLVGCLEFAEKFNGIGYRNKGVLSPYVWAGTNNYTSGLYTSDGSFNSNKVDQRFGVFAIMEGLK